MAGLTPQSLTPGHSFNWAFFIELLVCGILTLFFLFYFNRLFATLVSYAVRAYTWHKYRVYVDIQALQISLLGGRVFFKGVRYHGDNETILVHDGYITWQYWLRRVKTVDCGSRKTRSKSPASASDSLTKEESPSRHANGGEKGGSKGFDGLPCRVLVIARGVECFIYNRTPAYDNILNSTPGLREATRTANNDNQPQNASHEGSSQSQEEISEKAHGYKSRSPTWLDPKSLDDLDDKTNLEGSRPMSAESLGPVVDSQRGGDAYTIPRILKVLPIQVECSKGAIVLGNENTRSILVAKFESAVGQFGANTCRSIDRYKQTINFDFTHPVIQLKPNGDFRELQLSAGKRNRRIDGENTPKNRTHYHWDYHQRKRKLWHSMRELVPYFQSSVDSLGGQETTRSARGVGLPTTGTGVPGHDRWLGLTRYLDDDDEQLEQERWKAIEYGKFSTILDSPSIGLSYYWDIPGVVPQRNQNRVRPYPTFRDDINGDVPPEYGIDLRIRGGDVNYGPWADRQRADLQTVFFPSIYQDATPASPLQPGQTRVSTVFKLVLEIEQETTLRIPTREDSKDWKWKGRHGTTGDSDAKRKAKKKFSKMKKGDKALPSADVRPFGWLDVKVLPDSTVSYIMDMVARETGFSNRLELDLRAPEMSSSVNHGLLWRSKSQNISCDLSFPLGWNTPRKWKFDVHSDGLDLFILRDHIFLLTDLVNDWASGPPGDFYTFIPFHYAISLQFVNLRLYLNANDSNIINNPSNVDENTFIVIWGQELVAAVGIPLDTYRPARNQVTFEADARDGGFELLTPTWNTQHSFLESSAVASMKDLRLDGSYNYYTTTSPTLTDTVLLNIYGATPNINLHGFLVRYFMKLKDNYFGEDLHFHTLEEYQDYIVGPRGNNDAAADEVQHGRLSNDLDVILAVNATDASAMLPANLYSATENTRIDIPSIEADLRFTNYYMDLEATFSPLTLCRVRPDKESMTGSEPDSNTQVFINGARINGHRLFGLPPTEPTYLCNWDFTVGSITGECSSDFLQSLSIALRCFTFSFSDDENALPLLHPTALHDVTFLRAKVLPIRVWLHVGQTALLFSTEELKVDFNDWAGSRFSERLHMFVPALTLAIVDARTANRHRGRDHPTVVTHAYIQTTVDVRMVQQKRGFSKDRELQQEHIKLHDLRTSRTLWLLHGSESLPVPHSSNHRNQTKRPAMPYPPMPEPVLYPAMSDASISASGSSSQSRTRTSSRKRSFISTSSVQRKRRSTPASSSSRFRSVGSDDLGLPSRPQSTIRNANTTDSHQLGSIIPSIRQMSSQSPPVRSERGKPCLPPSSITLSSPYIVPYFPLHMVEPDLEQVPSILEEANNEEDLTNKDDSGCEWTPTLDEKSVHTSFLVRLVSGLMAYCTPDAFYSVIELLSLLQPRDPVSALDTLQMDVLTEVFALARNIGKPGGGNDISLQIPYIHLRIKNIHGHGPRAIPEQDYYDLVARKFAITARSTVKAQSEREMRLEDQSSLHVSLDHVGIAAKECIEGILKSQASVHADLYDLVAWSVSGNRSSGSVQFKEVQIVSTSRKVEYLASLVHRTTTIIDDVFHRFLDLIEQDGRRRRYLVLLLTTAGIDTPDPSCLTGASYVLRSITDHPRTTDSWKMMAHLRFVYQHMTLGQQDDILKQCFTESRRCPDDAEARVIASFDQWRTWDLAHAKKSLLVQKVYGSLVENSDTQVGIPGIMNAAFKAGKIHLVIDPGPKQNEIAINTMVVGIALNQPLMASEGFSIWKSSSTKNSMVQIHCLKTTTRLTWELCELVEDILRLFNEYPVKVTTEGVQARRSSSTAREEHHLHVVLASETNMISLSTINLKFISLAKGIKTSFVMSAHQEGRSRIAANFLVSADAVTSEVLGRCKILTVHKLKRPSTYIFVDSKSTGEALTRTWKAACASQSSSFDIREDLLGLLESVDLVLGDEVAYILELVQSLRPTAANSQTGMDSDGLATVNRIYIALFLDAYSIRLALLPSLSYVISGSVARASLAKKEDFQMLVDLDLKEHFHAFVARAKATQREVSSLRMPPINGRVVASSGARQHSMVLCIAIERVIFDAAAVHAILSTINRSEIASLFSGATKDFDSIKEHGRALFSDRAHVPERKTSESQLPLLYNGQITLEGLDILATTPSLQPDAPSAQLKFDLGLVQMKITNRSSDSGSRLDYVECELFMREMRLDLVRSDGVDFKPCGEVTFGIVFKATSKANGAGELVRSYQARSNGLEINLFAETASVGVNMLGQLQDRMKALDFSREIESLQRLGRWNPRLDVAESELEISDSQRNDDAVSASLFRSMYSLEMKNIQISWNIGELMHLSPAREPEDLVLSFKKIDLSTRKENAARLIIEYFQLQMVPTSSFKKDRSLNSALLPEVVFNVAYLSTAKDRRFAFQAAGKSLDLRLTSQFILPASDLQRSIALASGKLRAATASWDGSPTPSGVQRKTLFGEKKLASLLVDADFAGAVVYIQGRRVSDPQSAAMTILRSSRPLQHGRYGQFTHDDESGSTTLRAPGIALKVQYKDTSDKDPSLNAEFKVASSSNVLYPTVVPIIMDISSAVKEVVGEPDETEQVLVPKPTPTKFLDEETLRTADPNAILGRCRLNLGLRICKQEFTLSCQPIARVAATARFEDIYITVSTVQSADQGRFFAISAAFTHLQMSVQHVYSRESTGTFDIQSIVLSLMNSKHVSAANGLSVMLEISPMKATINAKQLQDFLLFREIWLPSEIRHSTPARTPSPSSEPQAFMVQRYQQVASAGAFPWNATIFITELDVSLDLGQGLGKCTFVITNFWVSSKKSSDWEQNLCSGFDKVSIESAGRMSGFVELQKLRLRTSIEWPEREKARNQTPLIQASLGFDRLRVKAAFDYQAFLIADVEYFEFLMYNVREARQASGDRLVGLLDGDKVQVFFTTSSASQGVALYQAIQRLVQEKQVAYEASLRDIEKFLRRKSTVNPIAMRAVAKEAPQVDEKGSKIPIQLHTDVVVTLKAVRVGAFPSTFFDNQIFKLEALDASARFAVALEKGRIHSGLGLTLGQLRIALAGVSKPNVPKTLGDVLIDDVVSYATGATGGTILRVPKVVATMQTWQSPASTEIDYIFKSLFEGKVDVGWNYSRISFIRGMWATHSRALAHRLGKPLPQSAVQIRGGPQPEGESRAEGAPAEQKSEKITAVVNVPQSKYQYTALEPAIIETPQLRDMGEATPPLEWIGLHRDRLPNLTHQIVIVSLLEVAKEVEDAYSKILGSS